MKCVMEAKQRRLSPALRKEKNKRLSLLALFSALERSNGSVQWAFSALSHSTFYGSVRVEYRFAFCRVVR